MRKDDEWATGSKSTRQNALLLLCIYFLFLLWLEPMIDWLMSFSPPDKDFAAIEVFNRQKEYVTTQAFAIARSFPVILFLWLGYRVMLTSQLPPKRISVPFTVKMIKGPRARMMGMFMIVLALLLLFREMMIIVGAQPG